mmetsp:Transcript_71153/g.170406  ORF Transcript_71153/g.170406 Transcript_71153/m.170406 type:complete len:361 (-) Transcript_71153:64-1146(-)
MLAPGCSCAVATGRQPTLKVSVQLLLLLLTSNKVFASAPADADEQGSSECAHHGELVRLRGEVAMLKAATQDQDVESLALQLANARADLAMANMLKQSSSGAVDEELAETKVLLTAAEHARSEMAVNIARLETQLAERGPEMERLQQEAAEAASLRKQLEVALEAVRAAPSVEEVQQLQSELATAKENATLAVANAASLAAELPAQQAACRIEQAASSAWADCDGLHDQLARTKKQLRDAEARADQLHSTVMRWQANSSVAEPTALTEDAAGHCGSLQEELMSARAALEVADMFRSPAGSDSGTSAWEDALLSASAQVRQLHLDFQRRDQQAVAIVSAVGAFSLLLALGCARCLCDASSL